MAQLSTLVAIVMLMLCTGYAHGNDIVMPSACAGKTYCTIQPDYYTNFEAEIDDYIEENKYWIRYETEPPVGAVNKTEYNEDNCGYETKIERPFVISVHSKEMDSDVNVLVAQSSKYFQQYIRTTKCTNKEISCFDEIKSMQGNIETFCDETFATITLFVYENGEILPKPLSIPVSCACKIQFKNFIEK